MSSIDDLSGLHIWVATNDPGEPICVGTNSDGLDVTIYYQEDGSAGISISGVLVYNNTELVASHGMIPAEVLKSELELANG